MEGDATHATLRASVRSALRDGLEIGNRNFVKVDGNDCPGALHVTVVTMPAPV